MKQRPPTATITGPHGIFRYHASYTDGIFCVEGGSIALTRKGIERKARRVLRKLTTRTRTPRPSDQGRRY
jgi:hypothetical protein